MSNSLLTTSEITNEALRILENECAMAKSVGRSYEEKFGRDGAKKGDTVNARVAPKFTVTDGAVLNVQNITDDSVPIVIDKQKHVGLQFTSKDRALSLDEFSERIIRPAVIPLANQIDVDLCNLYQAVYQSVGTPGTPPAALSLPLQAKRILSEAGCPADILHAIVNPEAEASMVDALKLLMHSGPQLEKQYEKGVMGIAGGFKWKMDQNMAVHTVGPHDGTPLVDGASESGASITIKGFNSENTAKLNVGDIFTIDGVYAVNPITKARTNRLMQFVCTANETDVSGTCEVNISPSLVVSGVNQNVNALPDNEAPVNILGAAGTVSPQNLLFHKDFATLCMVDLPVPEGVDMGKRVSHNGLSIRLVRDYDITNDRFVGRFDVLYGVKAIRPELAVRMQG